MLLRILESSGSRFKDDLKQLAVLKLAETLKHFPAESMERNLKIEFQEAEVVLLVNLTRSGAFVTCHNN